MATKKVNADLEVAGTVTGDGVNLNEQVALLSYLIPTEPLPLNALEFEAYTPVTGCIAYAEGLNYAYGIGAGNAYVPNIVSIPYPHWLTVDLDRFGKANQGELRFYLNDVLKETLDLSTANVGDGELIVLVSRETYNNFPPFQKGQARVTTSELLGIPLVPGANKIRLEHWVNDALYGACEIVVFYDNGIVGGIGLTGLLSMITPQEPASPAYLSGIKFMPMGGQYLVKVVLEYVFMNTFLLTPLIIVGCDSGIADIGIPYNDAHITGVSSPPVNTEDLTYENTHTITLAKFSTDAIIKYQAGDPFIMNAAYSIPKYENATILVDSLSSHQSTETREYFTDEFYRLPLTIDPAPVGEGIPTNITGQWTSFALLANGNAQVFGSLVYPTINFASGYFPALGQPDYSAGFIGEQKYERAVRELNVPHSSGVLKLNGYALSDIEPAGDVKVEIKLPDKTGWLDLGKPFDAGTFTGADGDGCRTGVANGNEFAWTAGQFSTADSGWMILVRITLKISGAPALEEIHEIGWED